MKKITVCLGAVLFFLLFIPAQAKAVSERSPVSIVATAPVESVEAKAMLDRLDEIHAMTKSGLNAADKKQLRQEVRQIKRNLKETGGGVYLSVGAIILLVVLLILLL